MSGTAMTQGAPATDVVGKTADVVANTASTFYNNVKNLVFLDTVMNIAQEVVGQKPMQPGQGVGTALGTSAEVYGLTGSPLGMATMGLLAMETVAVGALLKAGTSSTPVPVDTQEEIRKAEVAKDDARREEAIAEETKRQAYFANKGPGM